MEEPSLSISSEQRRLSSKQVYEVHIDRDRQPTISVQTTYVRDGGLTVDTMLDRVVFGEPILAEDTWQLGQLHEVSRRRSGECGVDVIVASAQRMSKVGRLAAQAPDDSRRCSAGAGEDCKRD